MEIRLIYKNGVENDWTTYNYALYKQICVNPPEQVEVHISDFYPNTPDTGTVTLSYPVFHALAREFFLDEEAHNRRDQRHLHAGALLDPVAPDNLEDDFIKRDTFQVIAQAIHTLKGLQKRRIIEHCVYGISIREIAKSEGCYYTTVRDDINRGLKKIKKYLKKARPNLD